MRKIKVISGVISVFLIALTSPLLAADMPLKSRITDVTVYTDRAIVTRVAEITLEAGTHRVIFSDLPLEAEPNSFRASTTSKVTSIVALSHHVASGKVDSLEVVRLEKEVNRYGHEIIPAYDDRIASLEKQKEMLQQVMTNSTEDLSNDKEGNYKFQEWESAYLFVSQALSRVVDSIRVVKREREVQDTKRREIGAPLEKLRSIKNKQQREVVVDVVVKQPTSAEIALEYMLPRATWSPLYNARLIDGNQIEIDYYAQVSQSTGEDWSNVNLTLSTAQPNRTAIPGDLHSRRIGIIEPILGKVQPSGMSDVSTSLQTVAMPRIRGGRQGESEYVLDGFDSDYGSAYSGLVGVSSDVTSYSTQFKVTRKETVPSGDKVSRIQIAQWTLDGTESLIARTQNHQYVFRTLKLVNKTGVPFLPGRFSLFVESALIGQLYSPGVILADQEFELAYGIEDAIEVKREILNRKQELKGDKRALSESVNIELTNHSNLEREVKLEEALPASSDSRVKVSVKSTTPEPESIDEQERAQWVIKLAPGEKIKVKIDYQIEYPNTMTLSGF